MASKSDPTVFIEIIDPYDGIKMKIESGKININVNYNGMVETFRQVQACCFLPSMDSVTVRKIVLFENL